MCAEIFLWSVEIFLIGQNRSSKILEVQFQNLGARSRQSFHFQKIPGHPNINIFFENWQEASFYIKEQTQKYNFEI